MIKVTSQNKQYPVLPAGTYGANGEAEIAVCRGTQEDGSPMVRPWKNEDGSIKNPQPCLQVVVKVNHPDKGVMRLNDWIDAPADETQEIGERLSKFFNQLGITDEILEAGFDETQLEGTPVIVTVKNTQSNGKMYANISGLVKL